MKKGRQMILGDMLGYSEDQKDKVLRDLFREMGRRGGQSTSEKKREAARANLAKARAAKKKK